VGSASGLAANNSSKLDRQRILDGNESLRVGDPKSRWVAMSYIVQRQQNFYVVDYRGRDPLTGAERRTWHPAGPSRSAAEAIKIRVDQSRPPRRRPGTLGEFMATTWIDSKPLLSHSTRSRYKWMLEKNVAPIIGGIALDELRPDDLDALTQHLLHHGGRRKAGLAAKTVLEIHRTVSNALDLAVDRHLIDTNPAAKARPPRPDRRSTVPTIWDAAQLATFLTHTATKRLHPALHLTAYTGIRRGELAGLQWRDLDTTKATLAIARTRQTAAGHTVEAQVKTRTSRRSIDLDPKTLKILAQWRQRLIAEGAVIEPDSPLFVNLHHQAPSPESFSQLFTRATIQAGLPHIRFHDLRHTHASLLVPPAPIKVVSERLGHAHPGFTMHTYQHLLPGMGATAASQFAHLIDNSR